MCDMLLHNTLDSQQPNKLTMWLCLQPFVNGRTISNEISIRCM